MKHIFLAIAVLLSSHLARSAPIGAVIQTWHHDPQTNMVTVTIGNFTPQPPYSTGDNLINANHDGISQPNELYTLPALGINSISLNYKASDKTDQYGNVSHYRAQLNLDKSTDAGKTAYDVFFVIQPPPTTAKACPAPPATGKQPASSILKH